MTDQILQPLQYTDEPIYVEVAPVSKPISATADFNTSININISNYVTGATDYSVLIVAQPKHGTAGTVVVNNGVFTLPFTPTTGYFGSDSFTYKVGSNNGTSNISTISIAVNPPMPVTIDGTLKAISAVATKMDLTQYITAGNSTKTTVVLTQTPSHGSATVSAKTITYTSLANYLGSDTVKYVVVNEKGTSNVSTISVNVVPAIPTCTASNIKCNKNDTSVTASLSTSIKSWTPSSTIRIVSAPSHGIATVLASPAIGLNYVPTHDYFGKDAIKYSVSNETGTSTATTISVDVLPPVPTIGTANGTVTIKLPVTNQTIDMTSSITNWTPASKLIVSTKPNKGTVTTTAAKVIYAPKVGSLDPDVFGIEASNEGGTSTETLIHVTLSLDPPTAGSIGGNGTTLFAIMGQPLKIDLKGCITNWTSKSSIAISSAPSHGVTSISGEVVTYTSGKTYVGTDTMLYTVTNEKTTSGAGTVIVTVQPPLPVVSTAAFKVISGSDAQTPANTFDLTKYITNWTDHSTLAISTTPTHGTATVIGKTIVYVPSSSYAGGADSLKFNVTNEKGKSTKDADLTITVMPKPPVASDKAITISHSVGTTAKTTIDMLSSITNWTFHSSLKITKAPAHGTATIYANTGPGNSSIIQILYKLTSATFTGSDVINYTATNETTTSGAATINITIN